MADDLAWRRFWSPRDASPLLENGGYLVDPEDSWLRRHTQLRELSRLRDIPCLILLGEPGMGKSYTLARTARDQSWVPPGAAVLSVDLRYQRLDPDLLDAPEYKDYLDGAHELHLFIDSLDESLAENATATLIRILARHPVHRLRLRVACRTGAVPHTLETELRRIWRDSGKTDMDVQIYELAPLRAVDVRLAAARGGVDTDAFLAALKPHRAELFAARPITLLCFLLPMFKAQRKLPERRWDLFEAGCRLLCDDPSASRHAAHTSGGQTASERMMIASRMAAAYQFPRALQPSSPTCGRRCPGGLLRRRRPRRTHRCRDDRRQRVPCHDRGPPGGRRTHSPLHCIRPLAPGVEPPKLRGISHRTLPHRPETRRRRPFGPAVPFAWRRRPHGTAGGRCLAPTRTTTTSR